MTCAPTLIFLGLILLVVIIGVSWNQSHSNYTRFPSSYYETGKWIDGPPINRHRYLTPQEAQGINAPLPHPLHLTGASRFGNPTRFHNAKLCNECMSICETKISHGVFDVMPGETIESSCLKRCDVECGGLQPV